MCLRWEAHKINMQVKLVDPELTQTPQELYGPLFPQPLHVTSPRNQVAESEKARGRIHGNKPRAKPVASHVVVGGADEGASHESRHFDLRPGQFRPQ